MTRWIVIYHAENGARAAMIDDDPKDGSVSFPFGVEPHQVADDCVGIIAIVEVGDNTDVPMVVIEDQEFDLNPADPDVIEEEVPE